MAKIGITSRSFKTYSLSDAQQTPRIPNIPHTRQSYQVGSNTEKLHLSQSVSLRFINQKQIKQQPNQPQRQHSTKNVGFENGKK